MTRRREPRRLRRVRRGDGGTARTTTRRTAVGAGSLAVGAALLTMAGFAAAPASAEVEGVAPVADVAAYPAPLPPGCPGGADAFVGLAFTTESGASGGDLAALTFEPGEQLTMSWTGLAAGCADADGQPAVPVTLAAYESPGTTFDPAVDQTLLRGWASCGGGAAPCTPDGTGGGSMTFTVPSRAVSCRWQLDAVLGAPLPVVGPSGSYYSPVLRGDRGPVLLVSAVTVDVADCAATVPTEVTTVPTQPTTQPTSPPTSPPTTVVAVESGAITAAPPAPAAAPVAVSAGGVATLPFTGSDSTLLAVVGLGLVAAGGGLIASGRSVRRLGVDGR